MLSLLSRIWVASYVGQGDQFALTITVLTVVGIVASGFYSFAKNK